ncbi:MAG: hypothetical protein Q9164_003206 [Protoblastenia rupestris]
MRSSRATALAAFAIFLTPTTAHSWIEQLTLIDSQGVFTGTPGYARSFTPRDAPGFTDKSLVHLLPPSDPLLARDVSTEGLKPTDAMCRKNQQAQTQTDGYPRLSAAPGSMIALRFQENGHVTLPETQKGKPKNRGNVYIYGTSQPKPTENFLDVFKQWNEAGTGGDKRGRLLATQPYDDGQCYQVNSGTISTTRQKEHPHPSDKLTGMDVWCQNDIKLPSDIPTDKPYTLYWVWDWPTEAGADPGIPKGKAEIYTTCMDIDIKAGGQKRSLNVVRDAAAQNSNNMAIPKYMKLMNEPAASSAPAVQSAPAAASSAPAVQSAPAAAPSVNPVATSAPAAPPSQSAASTPAAVGSNLQNKQVDEGTGSVEAVALSALGSQLVSQIAAQVTKAAAATVTVTASQPPAAAATPPAQNSAAAKSPAQDSAAMEPAAQSPPAQNPDAQNPPAQNPSGQNAAASPAVVPSMPPTSLDVASPIMSPTAAAPPAAAPAQSGLPTFSGTATPAGSGKDTAASGAPVKRSCDSGACKKMRRSRIFGTQK